MSKIKKAGALAGAHRLQKVKAFSSSIDVLNNTEPHSEVQSELLAIRALMKRAPVSFGHAKVICELQGLGGLSQ